MHSPLIPITIGLATLAALSPRAGASSYYEATFTGTISHVDFGADDPGPFAGVAVGQTYTFVIQTGLIATPTDPWSVSYPVLSSTLHFDDGSPAGIEVPTGGSGSLGIGATPGIGYQFGAGHGVDGVSGGVGVYLWDDTEPYVRNDTALPPALDLGQFDPALGGFSIFPDDPNQPGPISGSIDGFSAQIIPTPSAPALGVLAGLGGVGRRRRVLA